MPPKPTLELTPSQLSVVESLRCLWERGLLLTPEQLAVLERHTPEPIPEQVVRELDRVKYVSPVAGETVTTEKRYTINFTGTVTDYDPHKPGRHKALPPKDVEKIITHLEDVTKQGTSWPKQEVAWGYTRHYIHNVIGKDVSPRTVRRFFERNDLYTRLQIQRITTKS